VALVAGCVQRVFFPGVNAATIRVLAAEGYDVIVPSGQECCGALSLHVGRDDEARRFAAALVDGFGDVDALDAVIVNAAGCGSTLKQYGELLTGQSAEGSGATAPGFNRFERFAHKVKDVTEFLAGVAPRAERNPMPLRVAYHDACHLGHAQRIREQPRALLRSIPGLELVEIPEGDQCCGSAGVYNILEPQSAAEIGARKVQNVLSTAPDVVASANPGCTLQMASILADSGMKVLSAHPIEILDAALA
jgi:glycolate oxidase iron-sulfur subunit